jgi:hypothetical protein
MSLYISLDVERSGAIIARHLTGIGYCYLMRIVHSVLAAPTTERHAQGRQDQPRVANRS